MKRCHVSLFVALSLCLASQVFASGETVFINLDKIYRGYYKTRLAYTQLNAQAERAKKDNQSLVDEFNALKDKYEQLRTESLDDALSEEIRINKRNEAEDALIDLQKKSREIRESEQRVGMQLKQQKSGVDKRILEQIRDAIKTEAQTKGYLAVFNIQNVGASELQSMMTVPYYDLDADITQDILKLLNTGYEEEEESAAEVDSEEIVVEETTEADEKAE